MGENVEIYARLNKLETELARLNERLSWMMRLTWLMFGGGGIVGWALAKTIGG